MYLYVCRRCKKEFEVETNPDNYFVILQAHVCGTDGINIIKGYGDIVGEIEQAV